MDQQPIAMTSTPEGIPGLDLSTDGPVGKGQDDVSGVRNDVYTAANVVNAAAHDVSVDRSADGPRRHLSESRYRVGQRGRPGRRVARIRLLFHADAVMPHGEWPPQLALRPPQLALRTKVCVLDPIRPLRVPGPLYGTTSVPGRQAQICRCLPSFPAAPVHRGMTHYRPFNIVTT